MNLPFAYEYVKHAPFPSAPDDSSCSCCGGRGEKRYVYCSSCGCYVDGYYSFLTPLEEKRGLRPRVLLQCGHEAYSLPGALPCPECGGKNKREEQGA
jgi:hypothetical protein